MTNPDHQRFADWAHLTGTHAPDHYVMTKLNRLRLDEVRAITREHFDIETERVFASTSNQGAGRLTPAIQVRHPNLAETDFTTQSLFVVARLKA